MAVNVMHGIPYAILHSSVMFLRSARRFPCIAVQSLCKTVQSVNPNHHRSLHYGLSAIGETDCEDGREGEVMDEQSETMAAMESAVACLARGCYRMVETLAVVMPQLAAMLDESGIDYSDDPEPDAVVTHSPSR
jgi:hypothetical protein